MNNLLKDGVIMYSKRYGNLDMLTIDEKLILFEIADAAQVLRERVRPRLLYVRGWKELCDALDKLEVAVVAQDSFPQVSRKCSDKEDE